MVALTVVQLVLKKVFLTVVQKERKMVAEMGYAVAAKTEFE